MKIPRDIHIERILDRQARLWESERVEHPPEEAPVRPNLTLSQRPYSGAEELAERLSVHLGWDLYDRRLVDALHENDALGKSVLEALDERLLSYREDWMYHLFVPGHTPAPGYVRRLSQLVFSIAMRGHAVFLGRGASFIVPREWRLAVLVTRPFESRIAAFVEKHGGGHEAARHELLRLDRERAEFVSRSFRRDADDPANHDLGVNLGTLGLDEAVAVVVQALSLRFPRAALLRHP
jgi:cytidylate kinase